MAYCVIDSSMALSWFLPGKQTAGGDAVLDRVTEDGALAPSLGPLEIGNVLLVAERRQRISTAQRTRALIALRQLPITIDAEAWDRVWTGIFDLGLAQGLTLYDAAYLDLSLRTGLALATLDKALTRAAIAVGVSVIAVR